MTPKPISLWAVPLSVGLGIGIGVTVGLEFGGDEGARWLYGGVTGVVVALVVLLAFVRHARRPGNDVKPGAAADRRGM
jgi:hypothetical protein